MKNNARLLLERSKALVSAIWTEAEQHDVDYWELRMSPEIVAEVGALLGDLMHYLNAFDTASVQGTCGPEEERWMKVWLKDDDFAMIDAHKVGREADRVVFRDEDTLIVATFHVDNVVRVDIGDNIYPNRVLPPLAGVTSQSEAP